MNTNSYVYAEVLEVLDNMESEYVEKIPQTFINYLKKNSSNEYKKHITLDKPLEKQNLNTKTLSILALINLKYWVETEEHKQELINQYKKNEISQKEKLKETVEINDIFSTTKELKKQEIDAKNLPIERKNLLKRVFEIFWKKNF